MRKGEKKEKGGKGEGREERVRKVEWQGEEREERRKEKAMGAHLSLSLKIIASLIGKEVFPPVMD